MAAFVDSTWQSIDHSTSVNYIQAWNDSILFLFVSILLSGSFIVLYNQRILGVLSLPRNSHAWYVIKSQRQDSQEMPSLSRSQKKFEGDIACGIQISSSPFTFGCIEWIWQGAFLHIMNPGVSVTPNPAKCGKESLN